MSAPAVDAGGAGAQLVRAHRSAAAAARRIGPEIWMLAVWLFLEFGKPTAQAFKIPMMITGILFLAWLRHPRKRWPRQLKLSVVFLALMALHVPFARNNFHAFWTTYYVMVTMMIVCAMVQFLDSIKKIRILVNVLLFTITYVGAWAATHAGFGPLGGDSGQDENYVAQIMCVGLPLAFFSIARARTPIGKSVYVLISVLFVVAAVVGKSRGGFLGMLAVGAYCWIGSSRKIVALITVAALGAVLVFAAPKQYWDDMRTITNSDPDQSDMRWDLWAIGWREFIHHPIAGVGPGNYMWHAGDYQTREQHERYQRSFAGSYVPHSLYIELIAEHGVAGIVLVGGILLAVVRDHRWIVKRREKTREIREARHLSYGLAGAMLGFLVCSAFLSNLYTSYLWCLAAFMAALRSSAASAVARLETGRRAKPNEPVEAGWIPTGSILRSR